MGLDIYFNTLKNPKKYAAFVKARNAVNGFERIYEANHPEMNGDYDKWEHWYEMPEEEQVKVEEPKFDFWSYTTPEEKAEKARLDKVACELEIEADLSDEIEELYMRKQNWMTAFVRMRHPEIITKEDEYGTHIKDGECILTIADVEDLVSRMEKITSNWKAFDGEMTDKNGFYSDNYKSFYDSLIKENQSIAEELLPAQAGFFFGGTTYDWYYYISLKRYCEAFKETLKTMKDEGLSLLYTESW